MEFRSCARGRQWCGIIHYYWWTASIKPRLLFSRAGYMYASWGLSLSSVNVLIVLVIHLTFGILKRRWKTTCCRPSRQLRFRDTNKLDNDNVSLNACKMFYTVLQMVAFSQNGSCETHLQVKCMNNEIDMFTL